MSLCGAVHLCTGRADHASRLDAWLASHDVPVYRCDDPFRLCVLILRQPELVPDLAFLGGGGLQGDDWAVLGYLYETWPHLGVVIYGEPSLRVPEQSLFTCRTEDEWQHITSGTPAALRDAIRRARGLPTSRPAVDVTGIPAPGEPLDGALSAEELSDLLERQGET